MDLEKISGLVLSPGLVATLTKIEQLKKENKIEEAREETLKALNMIRISSAVLRWNLAEQYRQKDSFSADALCAKAIDHLRKDAPEELKIIDAIKREMHMC